MPIYAYKCESCGFAKDVLQKMSDTPLTVCPQCAAASFKKQLTAAGFQLKGSGWYVTDFRGGDSSAATKAAVSTSADGKSTDTGAATGPAAASPPVPAAAPAAPASSASGDASSKSS